MKKCSECKSKMIETSSKTPDGVEYDYYRCNKCGEEILDVGQLGAVAKKYREMKRHRAKINRWGLSMGIRIPKDIVQRYHLKPGKEVSIVPDKKGILIVV